MSTTTDLRQGLVSNMSGKMVAEVHSIRRSVDGEVKDFTSFLSQEDYRAVYGGIGQGDHYSRGTIFPGVLVGGDVVGQLLPDDDVYAGGRLGYALHRLSWGSCGDSAGSWW